MPPPAALPQRLWNINGRILTALSATGNVYHYDVSMPHDKQYPLVQKLRKEAGSDITKVTTQRVTMETGGADAAVLLPT